jgi:hypothetical protein
VRPREDAEASRESPNAEPVEPASDCGVTSMVSEEVNGDNERPGSSGGRSGEGQRLEAGGSGGGGGGTVDVSVTAPVGLGLGGLQPLPARVSRYMFCGDVAATGSFALLERTGSPVEQCGATVGTYISSEFM